MSPLFKKKDKTTIAELEEYYANQNRRRSGRAWFMALLSLLITAAILIALIFVGRWIYRTFFEDDSTLVTDTTQTESGEEVSLPNFDSEELGDDRGVSFTEGSSNNPDDVVVDNEGVAGSSGGGNEGTVSDEAATTTEPNTDRLASGSGSTTDNNGATNGSGDTEDGTVAGSSSSESIPDTGAGESIIAMLIAVSILGYLGARKHQLKQ